ncbi:hypothetical protein [Aurantimonas coralicida]|uniref:hypothetical protein n=1 Tax=Aurantimonas coralicida TaxID=182270 RepID=UPI001E28E8C2|nr:hypothetical protein [Aurantimonas coralicida]MCD1645187.1 hypothetical protein [Aurantimonas coralicida]
MTDYSDLIARLEKADGASRQVDVDVYERLRPASIEALRKMHDAGDVSGYWFWMSVSKYTESLDAAIALTNKMLPGWTMAVDATVPGAGIDYSLYSPTDPDGTQPTAKGGVRADSIGDVSAHARALLIATLSALQSLEQKEAA